MRTAPVSEYAGKIGYAFNNWLEDRYLAISLKVENAVEARYAEKNGIAVDEIPNIGDILRQHGVEWNEAENIDETSLKLRWALTEAWFRQGFQDGYQLAFSLLGMIPETGKEVS
ncbi:MAG: hypothetical protein ABSC17_06015 [Thermacetogeniaceae bacterium]